MEHFRNYIRIYTGFNIKDEEVCEDIYSFNYNFNNWFKCL